MGICIEISLTALVDHEPFSSGCDVEVNLLQGSYMDVVEVSLQFAVQGGRVEPTEADHSAEVAFFFFVEVQQIRSKGIVEQLV